MLKVIDLDFYRKHRIILPVRLDSTAKNKSYMVARTAVKQLRRRRKSNAKSKTSHTYYFPRKGFP